LREADMRLLYEAQNSIDGQLILDLMTQNGLNAALSGEYLQGGVGELQAMGVVRVMIEEEHYETGRQLVEQWESEEAPLIPESEWNVPAKDD